MSGPYQKVTLNLHPKDVTKLKEIFGYGWSEQVRRIVHEHLALRARLKSEMSSAEPYTQEDLADD